MEARVEDELDLLIAGLGPGGCTAALAAHARGLRCLAVEARGPEARRSQLVLLRPGARTALEGLQLPDVTEGRRTTTIRQVENRLRGELVARVAASGEASPLALHWHTAVTALDHHDDHVQVTLQAADGAPPRRVRARHLIDATGGRLEPLGRPARVARGPSHWVVTAEYAAPPWFDGIVGVSDPVHHDLYLLFPTWGRRGVIAYLDTPPARPVDEAALARRFALLAERLGLGAPLESTPPVDVYQRGLAAPGVGRVLPIGDAVGTVDVLLGAGMSTAIEDGADAVQALAAAQRAASPAAERALTQQLSQRLFTRHRASMRRGRLLLAVRPLLERFWPRAELATIDRTTPGPPPLLWPMVRFVFGRRPQAS